MSLREVSSLRLDLRVDSSLEMLSLSAVTSGSSVGASTSSSSVVDDDDSSDDSSVAAESSTAFSSSLIRRKLRDDEGVITKSHDVKAQRRTTELVFVGVKADDEAISVVSASAAAGRGVMMVVMVSWNDMRNAECGMQCRSR